MHSKGLKNLWHVNRRRMRIERQTVTDETPKGRTKRSRMEISPTQTMSLVGETKVKVQITPLNISMTSYLWDEDEGTSIKNSEKETGDTPQEKRRSISGKRKMKEKTAILIKKADREMREMRKLIAENQNTKKEIKQLVKRLSSVVSQLATREVLDTLEDLKEVSRAIIMIEEIQEIACQTENTYEKENTELRETSTQTENSAWQIRNLNSNIVEKIKKKIAEKRGFERWAEIALQEWPAEVYVSVPGNPIWENNEGNLVFAMVRGDKLDKGVNRQIRRRFPEIIDLPVESGFASLSLETKIAIARGEINSRRTISRFYDEEDERQPI